MFKPLSINAKLATLIIICLMTIVSAFTNKTYGQQILDKMDKKLVDRYNRLTANLFAPGSTAAIDSFYNEALKSNNWHHQFLAYRLKAHNYYGQNKFDEAVRMARKSAAIADEHGEEEAYYDTGDFIMTALTTDGKNYQALKEAHEMSKKAVKDKCTYGIILTNYYLGKIFSRRGDSRLAIHYFEKELETMKKMGLQRQVYMTYIFLSNNYSSIMKKEKLRECMNLASEYAYDPVSKLNARFSNMIYLYDFVTPEEFHKRYVELCNEELYAKMVNPENQKILKVLDLMSCNKGEEAIALSYGCESKRNILQLRILALKKMKRYKEAMELTDSMIMYDDSVRSKLQLDDLAEIQASLNDAKLEMEAERKAMHSRYIIMALVIALLLVATLSFAYIMRKRRMYIKVISKKNRELTAAHERTEKALEMKTSFIHNMSHEIRTPLNQISGFSQMLATDDLNEEEKENGRKIIISQTEHLVKMLNTVIEISDLETKTDKPEMGAVQLKAFLQDLTHSIPTQQEGVSLSVGDKTDPSLTITTNANSLRRIMLCLADNAVKFTSKGSISIEAMLNDKGQTMIVVEDTGCGIKPENAQRVFERFFKEDNFVPGTGLGLSIARMIAEYISASLTLDTTVETGCRFVLTFPQ